MTVSNSKSVHSIDDGDVENDHLLNHCALSHVHYLTSRIQSNGKRVDRISNISNWRKHAFSVILPRKLSECDDSDLRLMLVSLKNTTVATSVHIRRIERELENRGSKLTILG
jgi:hypothetical protein